MTNLALTLLADSVDFLVVDSPLMIYSVISATFSVIFLAEDMAVFAAGLADSAVHGADNIVEAT